MTRLAFDPHIPLALLAVLIAVAPQKVKAVMGAPVQVINSLAQWIPVGSVDEPGRNPVMAPVIINTGANSGNATMYTVRATSGW